MKIVVYGLGIIGASVAASLKRAGHTVYGKNRSRESIVYALEHGMIDAEVRTVWMRMWCFWRFRRALPCGNWTRQIS